MVAVVAAAPPLALLSLDVDDAPRRRLRDPRSSVIGPHYISVIACDSVRARVSVRLRVSSRVCSPQGWLLDNRCWILFGIVRRGLPRAFPPFEAAFSHR